MLYAGSATNQVDKFSCTNFCLLAQTACTCTDIATILIFEVKSNSISGERSLRSDDLNMTQTLAGLSAFNVLLTDSSNGILTATLKFTTISEYQGYVIICDTGGESPSTVSIDIQGMSITTTHRLTLDLIKSKENLHFISCTNCFII